jgi:hypothetical protein
MDTDWRLTGETGRRVYHVSINHGLTTLFFFAVGFVLVGTLAPLLAGVPRLDAPATEFLTLLLAALIGGLAAGGLVFLWQLHAWLVITPRELIFHGVGYSLRAAWDHAGPVTVASYGARPVRGLRARRAVLEMSPWLCRGPQAAPARALLTVLTGHPVPPAGGPIVTHVFFPIGLFAPTVTQLDVWDEIELQAPHLFEAEEPLDATVRRLAGRATPLMKY